MGRVIGGVIFLESVRLRAAVNLLRRGGFRLALLLLGGLLLMAATSLAIGYCLQRTRARFWAWLFLVGTVAVTERLLADEAPGLRMLALTALTAYGMKALVGVETRRRGLDPLSKSRWLLFAPLWIGMQPQEFASRRPAPWPAALLGQGLGWLLAGTTTIVIAKTLYANLGSDYPGSITAVFLAGCIMAVHFGFSGVVAAVLIRIGFRVAPQFRAPWRSQSLAEFWTRRWNVGFSVMTMLTIYRPLAPRLGRTIGVMLGFLFSALLHELVCCVPVGAGYGLPTIYFTMHGVAVLIEQALERRGVTFGGPLARIWVYCWVLLPVPLVFHDAFLRDIILPLM